MRRLITASCVLLSASLSAWTTAQTQFVLTTDEIRGLVTDVADLVSREYFDRQVAERVAGLLRGRLAEGRYQPLARADVLAVRLTSDLLAETGDKHLYVGVRSATAGTLPAAVDARQRDVVRTNAGVQRVEVLNGNVGYLNLTRFWREEEARDVIDHAIRLLQRADALIIDLRENGGGSPGTVALLAGYLFEAPAVPLFRIVARSGEASAYATPPQPLAERNGTRPVYLLTSARTFSAAEGFAYLLQGRRRAEVIGERTPGAANPGMTHVVRDHFEVTVPTGRVESAVGGGNWEGRGVTPDVQVPAADALPVAHRRALDRLGR